MIQVAAATPMDVQSPDESSVETNSEGGDDEADTNTMMLEADDYLKNLHIKGVAAAAKSALRAKCA